MEVWRRGEGDIWSRDEAGAVGRIRLESLPCEIGVDEIYRGGPEEGARP